MFTNNNLIIIDRTLFAFVSIIFLDIGYHPINAMNRRELSRLGDSRIASNDTAMYMSKAAFAPNSSLKIRTQMEAIAGPTYSAKGKTPPKNMNVIERAERMPPKAVR